MDVDPRTSDDDAVQLQWSAQRWPGRASRRHDIPRRPVRQLSGLAPERHGQVGVVHRLPRQDGAVIAWWYRGEYGSFTCWPDGPLAPPKHLDSPLWNRG